MSDLMSRSGLKAVTPIQANGASHSATTIQTTAQTSSLLILARALRPRGALGARPLQPADHDVGQPYGHHQEDVGERRALADLLLRYAELVYPEAYRGGGVPRPSLLGEYVDLVEGLECVDDPEVCLHADLCATRDVWAEMQKAMRGVLESTTLQDLIQRQREKENPEAVIYCI